MSAMLLEGYLKPEPGRPIHVAERHAAEQADIMNDLPGADVHAGCWLAFGPSQKLFVSTGDATVWDSAQKLNVRGGKNLRMNDDAGDPQDSPFGAGSPIFAVGVRSPQGLGFEGLSGKRQKRK